MGLGFVDERFLVWGVEMNRDRGVEMGGLEIGC